MQNVLVFGAGGYLGIPLCHRLTELGWKVTGADTFWFGKGPKQGEIYRVITADTRTVERGVFQNQDAVIDVAGLSNDASAEIDETMTDVINLFGGIRIAGLAKAAGISRYVYSSSASVYGHSDKTGLSEDDGLNPLTAYARSKVSVENYLREIENDTFHPIILRNSTVFGVSPRMRFDLVVNRMTAEAFSKGIIKVEGGGSQRRPLIHVDDAVEVFCRALMPDFDPGTYNVGYNSMNYSIRQIASIVAENTGAAVVSDEQDAPDRRDYSLCFNKISRFFADPVSIDVGVGEIIAALKFGAVSLSDPSTNTLSWYKRLIEKNGGLL